MRILPSAVVVSVLLFHAIPGSHAEDGVPRNVAILIGIEQYREPLSNLRYCVDDALDLKAAFEEIGFEVVLLADGEDPQHLPTKANIERALAEAVKASACRDKICFAFSGHGIHLSEQGGSFLCAADADLSNPTGTMVRLDYVYDELSRCRATLRMLFIDACRNEPGARGAGRVNIEQEVQGFSNTLANLSNEFGIAQVTSCSTGQFAWEHPELENGVFTHFLLDGLDQAWVTRGDHEELRLLNLYDHVQEGTSDHAQNAGTEQTPTLQGIVALNPVIAARVNTGDTGNTEERPVVIRIAAIPQRISEINAHSRAVQDIEFLPGGNVITIADNGNGRNVLGWDLTRGVQVAELGLPQGGLKGIVAPLEEEFFFAANHRRIFDSRSPRAEFSDGSGFCSGEDAIAITPDGSLLAIGGTSGEIVVLDIRRQNPLGVYQHARRPVMSLTFSSDGRYLAAGCRNDDNIKVWDLSGEDPVRDFNLPEHDQIWRVRFAPDTKNLLILAGSQRVDELEISRWNFQKRVREAVMVIELPAPPRAVDISPEWDRIATGHVRGGLYVWSTTTGESAFDFTGFDGHDSDVTVVQFSPDGRQLASGDQEGKVIGWSVP